VSGGYIKWHRCILESSVNDLPVSQRWVWTALCVLANWGDTQTVDGEAVERGQLYISVRRLASKANVSRGTVERALKAFQRGQKVTVNPRHRKTLITILNYEQYQCTDLEYRATNGATNGPQIRNKEIKTYVRASPRTPTPGGSELSAFLRDLLVAEKPDHALSRAEGWTAARQAKWGRVCDLILGRDARSLSRAKEILTWVFGDQGGAECRFVVESPDALRRKWDKLDRACGGTTSPRSGQTVERGYV
jgi:hypothetical protein